MAKHKNAPPEVSTPLFSREALDAAPFPPLGFSRLPAVLRLVPVRKSTWWNWVKDGKAPPAYKLSPGVTAWKNSELLDFLAQLGSEKEAA